MDINKENWTQNETCPAPLCREKFSINKVRIKTGGRCYIGAKCPNCETIVLLLNDNPKNYIGLPDQTQWEARQPQIIPTEDSPFSD